MKRSVIVSVFIFATFLINSNHAEISASDVAKDIYSTCLKEFSTSCIKPKALAWLSKAVKEDVIKITDNLAIIRTGEDETIDFTQQRSGDARIELFDKIDSFLTTHSIRMNAPEFLKSNEARSLLPKSFLSGGLADNLEIPLADGNAIEGRGFVKKVMIPFLIGLKFKTTVLVPLALALIALKTWKAMTLGLLSLVLSGALVIFKFAQPKVVNYEVVHYPHHHVEHHVDHIPHIEHLPHHIDHIPHIEHLPHHIDHIPHIEHLPHHIEHIPHHDPHVDLHDLHHDHLGHVDHHVDHWARQFDGQEMAYAGQI